MQVSSGRPHMLLSNHLGRGHEHFHDEIQRLFEWMELHERNFFPREFRAMSMRRAG